MVDGGPLMAHPRTDPEMLGLKCAEPTAAGVGLDHGSVFYGDSGTGTGYSGFVSGIVWSRVCWQNGRGSLTVHTPTTPHGNEPTFAPTSIRSTPGHA